ncbi:MAG: hypothetical protein IJL92_06890 [Thermoguttaceae bacterium]|nr:hypothetical protein [Thermoguttaceae bacterium]
MTEPETIPTQEEQAQKEQARDATLRRIVVATPLFCVFWPFFCLAVLAILQVPLYGRDLPPFVEGLGELLLVGLYFAWPAAAIVGLVSNIALFGRPNTGTGMTVFMVFTSIMHILTIFIAFLLVILLPLGLRPFK